MKPPVLIVHAPGTNRDHEAAEACAAAGGAPEIVPLGALIEGARALADYRMMVLPGGFSYGDDLGAGRAWAIALRQQLGAQIEAFVAAHKPVLGICNGFQVLIKAGLLPGPTPSKRSGAEAVWATARPATLTHNASGRFECRWVTLTPEAGSPCVFTRGLTAPIDCPVAHGEGRFVARDPATLAALEAAGQIALRYAPADLSARGDAVGYPDNPNGSMGAVAAMCNPAGNVMGLMPHPEDHIWPAQHPRAHRGAKGRSGLALFAAGVAHAAQV